MGLLVAAGVCYALFFLVERFVAEPLLPPSLWRNQLFVADSLLSMSVGMVSLSLLIYLPLYFQGVLGESATNSGEVVTPLTVSTAVGAALTGVLIAKLGRYHLLALLGGLLACGGSFLFTQMGSTTSLAVAWIGMGMVGLSMGMFFPILNLVVQNGLPRRFLGAGTAAITYVWALGQMLGLALVGTVVNQTINTSLLLPASARQVSSLTLKNATNPQMLVDPILRHAVLEIATFLAEKNARSLADWTVPPGPHHAQVVNQIVQQAGQQEQVILNQIETALKQALTVAIVNGFWVIFLFCCLALFAALFLKDQPLSKEGTDV